MLIIGVELKSSSEGFERKEVEGHSGDDFDGPRSLAALRVIALFIFWPLFFQGFHQTVVALVPFLLFLAAFELLTPLGEESGVVSLSGAEISEDDLGSGVVELAKGGGLIRKNGTSLMVMQRR